MSPLSNKVKTIRTDSPNTAPQIIRLRYKKTISLPKKFKAPKKANRSKNR
jgi:hypothetical protein